MELQYLDLRVFKSSYFLSTYSLSVDISPMTLFLANIIKKIFRLPSMDEIFMEFFTDSLMAVLLFILILSTVIMTRRFKNIWVNRKLIHLSVTPAVLSYMYLFKEPYVFFLFGIFIAFF